MSSTLFHRRRSWAFLQNVVNSSQFFAKGGYLHFKSNIHAFQGVRLGSAGSIAGVWCDAISATAAFFLIGLCWFEVERGLLSFVVVAGEVTYNLAVVVHSIHGFDLLAREVSQLVRYTCNWTAVLLEVVRRQPTSIALRHCVSGGEKEKWIGIETAWLLKKTMVLGRCAGCMWGILRRLVESDIRKYHVSSFLDFSGFHQPSIANHLVSFGRQYPLFRNLNSLMGSFLKLPRNRDLNEDGIYMYCIPGGPYAARKSSLPRTCRPFFCTTGTQRHMRFS